jgi:hypothetical protein
MNALRDVPLTAEERQPVVVARLGLHSHTCTECGRECACYREPCAARGRATHPGDRRQWLCAPCREFPRREESEAA